MGFLPLVVVSLSCYLGDLHHVSVGLLVRVHYVHTHPLGLQHFQLVAPSTSTSTVRPTFSFGLSLVRLVLRLTLFSTRGNATTSWRNKRTRRRHNKRTMRDGTTTNWCHETMRGLHDEKMRGQEGGMSRGNNITRRHNERKRGRHNKKTRKGNATKREIQWRRWWWHLMAAAAFDGFDGVGNGIQ